VTTSGKGWRRRTAGLVGSAAVAVALAGCTGAGGSDARSAMQSSAAAPGLPSATASASPGPSGQPAPSRGVSCDVHTCTLTLRTTDPREVRAFGASLALAGVQDGVASLTVGDARVECGQGEGVRAGPLTLFCDDVTAGSVTLTAEVG
jgi:hypothetical protein